MGKLLYEVKGGGQGQAIAKSEVQAAADGILQPLMDLLDGNSFYWLLHLFNYHLRFLFVFRLKVLKFR